MSRTFKGRLIITQYTGLKDNTGKEIYDGDILTNLNLSNKYIGITNAFGVEIQRNDQSQYIKFNDIVKVEHGARIVCNTMNSLGNYNRNLVIGFLLRRINDNRMIDFSFDENECDKVTLQLKNTKIIGNIFENQDLLK